jgi:hypothetical protein
MARLIDDPLWGKIVLVDSQKLQEILDKIEPSDLVPVTRCKDCKHRPYGKGEYDDLLFPDDICPCQCDDFWYSWIPDDDWFCKNGERGEE